MFPENALNRNSGGGGKQSKRNTNHTKNSSSGFLFLGSPVFSWNMKSPFDPISLGAGPTSGRSYCMRFLPSASLIFIVLLLGSAFILSEFNEKSSFGGVRNSLRSFNFKCKNHRRPHGSEPLPLGMVSATSNLEMRPLWTAPNKPPSRLHQKSENSSICLLAMAVGIKQKDLVGKMVKKIKISAKQCRFCVRGNEPFSPNPAGWYIIP